ncbi:TatD family hydrolase [Candidatus Daviesbacteria bacterium]|nr:TatD family hydrolase [Candidatus Daviesbacteria bacterium]
MYWDSFKEDFDEMIQRAADAGISTIINVGVDIEKSQVALDQTKNTKWPKGLSVYSTIGIHPHEAIKYGQTIHDRSKFVQEDIIKLEEIYRNNPDRVVAVGECGLDFFQNNNDNDHNSYKSHNFYNLQIKLFEAQINLARKLRLPLIVHCREAWDETLEMLGDQPAILHCYSGFPHTTQYIIHNTNFYVSFAANITYPKNEYLREAAKILPLDRILLETDSPFLAPQSKRGQRNEPSAVAEIAQLIADLKGISLEEVAEQTTNNAKKIFNI